MMIFFLQNPAHFFSTSNMYQRPSNTSIACILLISLTATQAFICRFPPRTQQDSPVGLHQRCRARCTYRNKRTTMMVSKSSTTFLIDFDGTLCDSIADTTQAAISAANILWPAEMQAALSLNPRRRSQIVGRWQLECV